MGSLREEYERRWVSGRDFNKSNATLRQQLDMDQDQRRAYLEWEQQTNEQNRLKTQAETQSKIFGNYADKYNSFSDQLKSFDQNAGGMLRAGTGGYYHSPDAYNSTLSELDKLKNTGEYLKYPWSLVQSADPDNASGLPSPTEITRYVADMTDLAESQRDYYGQYKSPGQYYSRPMVPEVTQREPEGPINPDWRQDYLKPDAKLPEGTQSIARGGKLGSDVKYTNWTQPQLSDDEQKAQLARGEEYSQYASGVPDNAKPAWQVTGTAGISLYKPDAFMEREIAYKKWKDNENSPYKTPVYVDVLKSSGQWETMPAAQRITAMKLGYQDEAKKYGKQIDGLGLRDRDGRVAEITHTLDYEQPTAEVQLALQEERAALLSGDLEETYSDLEFRREGAEKLAKKYETLEGWQKFDQKYQYVWNNADFVDLSGYDANKLKPGNPASQYYEYLNAGPERKRELESATTVPVFSLSGFMSPTVMESNIRLKGIDELDADEILVFNYLYNKKGADAAMEYLDGKGTELLSRRALTRQQRMEEMTENSLELASLATLYWQMENAVTGPVQFVAGMLGTDPNDPIFDRQSDVVTVRSKAGQVLDQVYGNAMIPILNVPVASTLYNAGMSAGDSLIGRALGAVVGYQGLNRLMMTSRVLGSEMQNSLKEGDSIGMSVFRGLSAAIIENVTESLGDKAFYGNPRSVALYLAQNFFAEGSEEFLANLGNTMVELAAKGTESEIYHKAMDAAHKRGWSRETAQSFAFKEWLREAGTDFLTGSLMGLMSGVAGAPGQQSRVNQVKTNEAYDAIMADEGIKYSPKDKASLGMGELLQGDTPTTIESALKPAEARTEGYDRAEQATTPYTQAQRQRDIALSRLGKTTQGDVGTQMANASVLDQAATWSNEQRLAALAEQESELEIRLAYGDKLDEAQAGLDSAQEGYAQVGESLDSIDSELAELRQRLDDLKALQNAELESPEATQEIDRAESKMAEIQTLLDRSTPTEQLPGAKAEAEAAEPVSKQAAIQTQLDTAEPVEQVPGQAPETGTADDRRTRLESQGIAAGSVEQFRQELESVDPESPDALERIAEIQKRMDMAGIKRAEEAQIPYHGRNISYKRENIPDIQEHRAKNPELNDEAFDFAAEAAYGAGLSGSKTLFEVSAAIKDLAPETAKALFDAGLGVYNAKAGERHALRQRMKDYMPKPGQGKLIIPKEVIQKMNPEQKKLAADLQKFIIMAGVEGDLFASETADESGRILSEEGSFDPSTGRFRFDINAGINFVAELKNKARGAVEFALPRVMGHEFTHYLKTTAPELYAVYQEAVIKELSAKNQLDDLILTELGRARKGALSIGVALEEVVARSSEMMLRDTQFMQNVMGEKPNLWEKFKAWVADFIKGIQERMKGMNPAYAGAKSLIETGNGIVKYAGNLQTLWDRAMADSIRYRMDAPAKPKTAPISPVGVVKDETLASLADGQKAANIAGNEGAAQSGGEQMKFSAREPVEEVGNLIAVHNLGAQQMQEVLRLGGFAMPSIAVLKAGTEHSRYGDISVVFGKETIDPVRDPRNKIYGGDAYTPSFPQINYEISGDNTAAVREKVSELLGELYKPFAIQISDDSIKRAADNNRGSFADAYENEPGLMGAYLKSIGEDFIPHSSEPEYAPWSGIGNQAIKYLADKMGRELQAAYNKPFDEKMAMEPAIRGVINEYFEQQYSDTLSKKQIKEMGAEEYGFNKIDEIIRGVGEYLKTKGAVRFDKYETGKMLRDRFEQDNHLPAYRAWLNELFAGAIAKSGIRNNADIFTPSGNRRSFDATHWQVTLDNIVRAMKAENSKGADGWASSNLFGVATKNFKSIADVRRDADRLRQMDDEAYKAEKDEFQERLVELASEIATKKEPNRFIAIDRAAEALTDAARAGTKAGMQRILNEYRDYHNIKADTAEKLDALIKDIMKMPTEYFEAKPERAVGLEEMRAVIHPNTTSKSLIDWMERKGVRRLEYEAGNEQDRLDKLNSVEDVRFSERDTEYLAAVESGDMDTAQEMVDEAAKAAGYTIRAYHGTKTRFNVFRSGDIGYHFGTKSQARHRSGYGADAVMIPAYLKLDNPLVIDTDYGSWESDYAGHWMVQDGHITQQEYDSVMAANTYKRDETLRNILRDKGYDGIQYKNFYEGNSTKPSYIVFDPTQIKRADAITRDTTGVVIPLSERFKDSSQDIRYSARPQLAPPLYSKMAREIEAFKGVKMGAESIIPYLRGKGVKADEIRWSGIQTFLQGKKSVTKDELLAFARGNELKIVDTKKISKADSYNQHDRGGETRIEIDPDEGTARVFDEVETFLDVHREIDDEGITYVDEVSSEVYDDDFDYIQQIANEIHQELVERVINDSPEKYEKYTLDNGTNYREVLFTVPDLDGTFQSAHWDEKNVLAHARLQDFSTADGKPVLFLEEVQSDWHEKGREQGYYRDLTEEESREFDALSKEYTSIVGENRTRASVNDPSYAAEKAWEKTDAGKRFKELWDIKYSKEGVTDQLVPPAPFATTWHEYVLKRVLRMAAEGDYDYVAWTTGAMQADRYGLEKTLSRVVSYKLDNSTVRIGAFGRDGGQVSLGTTSFDLASAQAMFGKELGTTIYNGGMNATGDDTYELKGQELKIGGEGMKAFYDIGGKSSQNIPRFLNKYAGQWGAKVQTIKMDKHTVPAVEVTEKMRESVLYEGQPMYSERDSEGTILSPQQVEYFKDSKVRKNGKLMPVYHGTGADFNIFTPSVSGEYGGGIYLTDNEGAAMFHAERKRGMPVIIKGFANITNPFEVDKVDYIKMTRRKSPNDVKKDLIKQGYDGIIGTGINGVEKQYVAFSQEQVKRTDNLTPTTNPDIRYAERDHDNSLPSARAILAGAFGEVAQTDAEKKRVEAYRKSADRYNRLENELNNLLEKRKQLYRDKAPQSEKNELRADINALRDKLDKADRVLLNLQMSKPLRDVVAREVDKAYGAYQEKAAERVAQARQGMRDTGVRGKIRNVYLRLMKALANPTEKQYVPAQYVRPLIDIAEAIDVSGKSVNLAEKIAKFKERYEALKTDTDYSLSSEFDESILNEIKALQKEIGATLPINLKGEQLERLYKVLRAVETTLMNARKLIAKGYNKTIYEYANQLITEVMATKGIGYSAVAKVLLKYTTSMLDARRASRLLSGYADNSMLEQLVSLLNDGQLKKNDFIMQGSRLFDFLTAGKENAAQLRKFTGRGAEWISTGIKDAQGHELKITPAMRASLYMHTLNADNLKHLLGGGITTPVLELYKRGDFKEAFDRGNTFQLTEEQVKKILAGMTAYEKAWVKAAQEFFAYSTEKINETSMQLVGYKKAMVPNYFPIQSNQNFTKTDFETIKRDGSIEGMGFLKERVGSTNPMYLMDITSVLDRQLNNTSKYVGLAIAVRNFNKVFNAGGKGYVNSVKETLGKKWGETAKNYYANLMRDVQGSRKEAPTFFDKAKGRFAQSVLALNPSVSLKQAASYPTAAAVLGWKPLMQALGRGGKKGTPLSRADQELIAKYTPLLWMRTKGMSTTELGDIRAMKPEFGAISKLSEAAHKYLLNWIQQIDTATVGRLWYAAQYNIDAARPDLEKGSDAYYQEVAKLFNRAVEETQPDYTVMQRPDILRNPNAVIRGMTMFMTQRLQNFGILYDAAGELMETGRKLKADPKNEALKSQRERAGKQLNRAIFSQAVSALVLSLMTLLGKAVLHRPDEYRDEDNQLVLGSIVEQVARDVPSILLGMVVGGAEMYETALSLLTGKRSYGLQFSPIEFINDLKTSFDNLLMEVNKTVAEGKDPKRLIDSASKVAMQALTFLGMPVNNAKKIVDGVYLHYKDFEDGAFGSFKAGKAGIDKRTAYANFVEAFTAGDQVRMDLLMKELQDAEVTESGIKSGIRAAIKANFEAGKTNRETYIQQMIDATDYDDVKNGIIKQWFTAGEIDEAEAKRLLQKFTVDDEATEQFKTLERWKHEPENDKDSYKVLNKFLDAVRTGKNLRAVVTEYTDPNKYAYDSKYLAGQITTAFKQEYIDNPAQRSKLKGYLLNAYSLLGYDREERSGEIDRWLMKYDSADFENAIATGVNLKAVIDEKIKYSTAKNPKGVIISQVTATFADQYKKMSPGERARIKPRLIDAYVMLGYDRAYSSKKIDKWLTD